MELPFKDLGNVQAPKGEPVHIGPETPAVVKEGFVAMACIVLAESVGKVVRDTHVPHKLVRGGLDEVNHRDT